MTKEQLLLRAAGIELQRRKTDIARVSGELDDSRAECERLRKANAELLSLLATTRKRRDALAEQLRYARQRMEHWKVRALGPYEYKRRRNGTEALTRKRREQKAA